MATSLGEPVHAASAVPPAQRATTPGWRDPRLWIGIVIVAASVVGGARLLASVDDSVTVWAAADDLVEGDQVRADALEPQRVRFAEDADLQRYLLTSDALPDGVELTRALASGELVPRSALGSAEDSGLLELPVAVDPEHVPPSVEAGSVVDLYVVDPSTRRGAGTEVVPALEAVSVVDAPALSESFGTSGRRQLVLAVPDDVARSFFTLMATAENPVLTVVRRD